MADENDFEVVSFLYFARKMTERNSRSSGSYSSCLVVFLWLTIVVGVSFGDALLDTGCDPRYEDCFLGGREGFGHGEYLIIKSRK